MSVPNWILDQLSRDDLNHQSWFPGNPDKFESFDFPVSLENSFNSDFQQEWLDFLSPYDPPKAVIKNLKKLSTKGAAVVCTGQQPGLLGGPFYSLSKAISAIHWAKELEKLRGKPVIPVFWVASDDHDFDEVATAHLLDQNFEPYSVSLPKKEEHSGHPVSCYNIDEKMISDIESQVKDQLPISSTPYPVLDLFRKYFQPLRGNVSKTTFETQFIRLMLDLLGPLGIVPIVPSIPFLRKRTLELIETDLQDAPATSEFLINEGQRLTKEVREAQGLDNTSEDALGIHRKGTELNFFWHRKEGRCRIEKKTGTDSYDVISPNFPEPVETLSKKDLLHKAQNDYLNLSPNAALRPLVQDSALPNLATIGGFGELAYHAQISGLYQKYEVKRPLLIPRVQINIVPPRVERFLNKVSLKPEQVQLKNKNQLTEQLMVQFDPTHSLDEVRNVFQEVDGKLDQLIEFLSNQNDATLLELTKKLNNVLQRGEKKVEKRLRDRFENMYESAETRWQTVWDVFWPDGSPQERTLTVISPLLALNGPEAIINLSEWVDGTDFKGIKYVNSGELSSEN